MVEFLDESEVDTLVMALATGVGRRGFTEDEASRLLEWANGVRLDQAILRVVLDGELVVSIDDGSGEFLYSTRIKR